MEGWSSVLKPVKNPPAPKPFVPNLSLDDLVRISVDLFYSFAKVLVEFQIATFEPATSESIQFPDENEPQAVHIVFPKGVRDKFFCLETDRQNPVPKTTLWGNALFNLLPWSDHSTFFDDAPQGNAQKNDIVAAVRDPYEGDWLGMDEPTTAQYRYWFYSQGALFMSKIVDPETNEVMYVGDLDFAYEFLVRPKYEPYGGRIFFDTKGELKKIIYGTPELKTVSLSLKTD